MAMTSMKMRPKLTSRLASMGPETQPELPKPRFPWGLTIDLHGDSLDLLELDVDDFDVGQTLVFKVKTKVIAVRKSETLDTDDESDMNRSVDLQITHMDMGGPAVSLNTILNKGLAK